MKNMLKRTLGLALVVMLLASLMMPVALAAKSTPVTNPTKFKQTALTTYTGMVTTLTLTDQQDTVLNPADYTWKSSRAKVVKVTKGGVITARKPGSATITATSKANKKDKAKIKITVRKNKVDNLTSKPSPSYTRYGSFNMRLKSVEIASPTKVVVEYYYYQNFPSSWKAIKLSYVDDQISVRKSAGDALTTIATGRVKNIKVNVKGARVKVVRVTYTGSRVKNTNLCLNNVYSIGHRQNMDAKLMYRRPR